MLDWGNGKINDISFDDTFTDDDNHQINLFVQ